MPETVSIRACARMLGISDGTIRHAIKQRRIVVDEEGRIDPLQAGRLWGSAQFDLDEVRNEGAQCAMEPRNGTSQVRNEGAQCAISLGSNKTITKNKCQLSVDDAKKINIVKYISSYAPNLRRVGREWEACCPFHQENTPSFKVDQEKGAWNCFGCGRKGDVIEFAKEIHQTDFVGAINILSREYGGESFTPKHERSKRKTENKVKTITTGLPHPEQAPPPPVVHPSMGSYSGRWEYRDKNGLLVEYRYRFDLPGRKVVIPLSWCRNEATGKESWMWKQAIAPRPLYRLHESRG
ncbi:MAG: hypothetical protein HQL74_16230 [Magnetococcales bacterium]|nr:hypothetical protein [Magnetococcales bacterium]